MTNDIKFNRGRGGLGRALAGEDHFSGLVATMTTDQIPAELAAVDGIATLFSVQDAEDLGIDYSENSDKIGLDSLKYAIDSIFEENNRAVVYLAVADTAEGDTVAEKLEYIQRDSEGKIRQALVLTPEEDFAVGNITILQAVADKLEAEHMPLSIIYAPNFVGADETIDLFDADLRDLNAKNVAVSAGQDGNGKGNELAGIYGKTIGTGGLILGMVSRASVHENIAWVGQFNANANSTNEFDLIKLADGRDVKQISASEMDVLNGKGYLFLKKHIGRAGSYFNDSHNAVSESSDYAYIENVRTIDKGTRGVRTFLLPYLNSPVYVNPEDGKLTEDTIATFKNEAERALDEMERLGEVSGFSVSIDPDQNVLRDSQIVISIIIVPVGVARNIVVNIGFNVSIQ